MRETKSWEGEDCSVSRMFDYHVQFLTVQKANPTFSQVEGRGIREINIIFDYIMSSKSSWTMKGQGQRADQSKDRISFSIIALTVLFNIFVLPI